jgi:hypothetical protein
MELSDLRQLRFPRPFRIPPALWPEEAWAGLARLGEGAGGSTPGPAAAAPPALLLADFGTGLWRIRQTLLDPGTGRPREDAKRAFRHLEATWDALREAGVEILDHAGEPYQAGMALDVIAFQPEPGVSRERILETVRPSIYIHGQPVQTGQVIVGRPEHGTPEAP